MPLELFKRFVRAYDRLSPEVQERVKQAIHLFDENWQHPSLRAKRLSGHRDIFYARIDRNHRMTYERHGDELLLYNVGPHDETLKNP
jgi:mRNA interferase RelE/StbE